MNVLIGYTGLIGGNLLKHGEWDFLYNSQNISDIQSSKYELVICAAARATKWWSNKNPEEDLIQIKNLINDLKKISANKFILISTVDIYPNLSNVNETDIIDINKITSPYGKNRYFLEIFCRSHFKNSCHIVRLPGVFGNGLKKNIIYDLVNDNEINKISLNSIYQWYYLDNLYSDVLKVIDKNIPLINLVPSPLATTVLVDKFFPQKKSCLNNYDSISYDVKTIYSNLFNTDSECYTEKKNITIKKLEKYFSNIKAFK